MENEILNSAAELEVEVTEPEQAEPEVPEVTEPEIEYAAPDGDAAQMEMVSQEGEETVSSGDAIVGSENGSGVPEGVYPSAEDIAAALSLSGTEVIVVQEYTLLGENAKPIEQYSVTEGLLLIIVLILVGHVISKLVGGALSCKYLFSKL